jgi:hypothetical protein
MSEKHNRVPSLFDLDELGFGDDDSKEPDTSNTINTIVEDNKTPGVTTSFLAVVGYMRRVHRKLEKRIDEIEKRDMRRMAWIAGALFVGIPILTGGVVVLYELVIKPIVLKQPPH